MRLPIEMICVCGADGALTPLRFRMEDEEQCLQTVVISQVLSRKMIQYVGIESIQFLCKGEHYGAERLFELSYLIRTHTWIVSRVLY